MHVHCIGSAIKCLEFVDTLPDKILQRKFRTDVYRGYEQFNRPEYHYQHNRNLEYLISRAEEELETGHFVKGPIYFNKLVDSPNSRNFEICNMRTSLFKPTNKKKTIVDFASLDSPTSLIMSVIKCSKNLYMVVNGTTFKNVTVMLTLMSKDIKRLSRNSILKDKTDIIRTLGDFL